MMDRNTACEYNSSHVTLRSSVTVVCRPFPIPILLLRVTYDRRLLFTSFYVAGSFLPSPSSAQKVSVAELFPHDVRRLQRRPHLPRVLLPAQHRPVRPLRVDHPRQRLDRRPLRPSSARERRRREPEQRAERRRRRVGGDAEGRGSIVQSDVGVEFKGVRSGVERRRGRCVGIETEVWAERRAGRSL